MLRRAFVGPILAAPPVRASQVWSLPPSEDRRGQIILNYEGKSVCKERNRWLVSTRTLVAGFNAPIDISTNLNSFLSQIKNGYTEVSGELFKFPSVQLA